MKIKILLANYGGMDVTAKLAEYIGAGFFVEMDFLGSCLGLKIPAKNSWTDPSTGAAIPLWDDPVYGVIKTLVLMYLWENDPEPRIAIAKEGAVIVIDAITQKVHMEFASQYQSLEIMDEGALLPAIFSVYLFQGVENQFLKHQREISKILASAPLVSTSQVPSWISGSLVASVWKEKPKAWPISKNPESRLCLVYLKGVGVYFALYEDTRQNWIGHKDPKTGLNQAALKKPMVVADCRDRIRGGSDDGFEIDTDFIATILGAVDKSELHSPFGNSPLLFLESPPLPVGPEASPKLSSRREAVLKDRGLDWIKISGHDSNCFYRAALMGLWKIKKHNPALKTYFDDGFLLLEKISAVTQDPYDLYGILFRHMTAEVVERSPELTAFFAEGEVAKIRQSGFWGGHAEVIAIQQLFHRFAVQVMILTVSDSRFDLSVRPLVKPASLPDQAIILLYNGVNHYDLINFDSDQTNLDVVHALLDQAFAEPIPAPTPTPTPVAVAPSVPVSPILPFAAAAGSVSNEGGTASGSTEGSADPTLTKKAKVDFP